MADAAIRSQNAGGGQTSAWRALLHRIGLPTLFSRPDRLPAAPLPIEQRGLPDASFPLLNAYAASAIDITRRAAGLDRNALDMTVGPVAVQALVKDVAHFLEPLARRAGLAVLRDDDSRCDSVCSADPGQLRAVLSHLLLRALSMEQAPGHVRVMVMLTAREAHILVLSRTPEATLAAYADAARDDLIAPQRLLKAMGGSLVLEPRRAGYLPLCIALPALAAAPAQRAA